MDAIKQKFFKRFSQVVILIPYLLSSVIVSYIVFAFLSPKSGFINHTVFGMLGLEPINWYADPKPWPVILIIVYIWMSFGYQRLAADLQCDHTVLKANHNYPGAAGRGAYLLF